MDRSPVQKTKLLFITERIDAQDDDLAFSLQWIEEFERQGFVVSVICLKSGTYPSTFRVHSLGKEKGYSKIRQLCIFYKLIFTVPHDRVFVHLSPYFLALGSPYWFLTRKPVYLWYTHYAMSMSLRISVFLAKRMFAATPQSLPQYEGNPKKTIVNHGVNSDFWKAAESTLEDEGNPHNLVSIHRLSRSKRLELVIRALALLPAKYTLTVYGRALDPVYFEELQALVKVLKLEKRVTFKGPVPMKVTLFSSFKTLKESYLQGSRTHAGATQCVSAL